MGITLVALDRRADALAALRRAVALKPDMPDAWREIGDLLILQGDVEGADAAYAQHIKASTQDPRLMAAAHALCENKIGHAGIAIARTLEAISDGCRRHPDVRRSGGPFAPLIRMPKICWSAAWSWRLSFNAARYNYAMALYRQNKSIAALQQVDLLMASEPRNSGYRNLRAGGT